MTIAVLALGSNLGNRFDYLQSAINALGAEMNVIAVSPVFQTAPVGGPDQDDFLNAVVKVDTTLDPHGLLLFINHIEEANGRVRTVHWGPRTLDIDIVTFGNEVLVSDTLTIPHPRAHERAFVLLPWLSIDERAEIPREGSISEILSVTDTQGVVLQDDLRLVIPSQDNL